MPLRFTLRQLEYLVAVGETGSVALAADRVKVSPPSVSAAIGQLEREFGLHLFVRRHAQGLAPTQAGRQFLAHARHVLAEAGRLSQLAADLSGTVRGTLRVGSLLTFAELIVPQLRRRFEARYPDVRVSQAELNQQQILDAIRDGALDLALTYDLDIPPDLDFAPLVSLPPYAMLPVGHPLANQATVTVGALADHPMVLLDLPLSADYFLSVFRSAGVSPLIAERTRDMAVLRSLVGNGFGYAIANIRPVNDLSPDGQKLAFVPLAGPVRPMVMGLVTAKRAAGVLSIAAFIDFCRDAIAEGGLPGINTRIAGARD